VITAASDVSRTPRSYRLPDSGQTPDVGVSDKDTGEISITGATVWMAVRSFVGVVASPNRRQFDRAVQTAAASSLPSG